VTRTVCESSCESGNHEIIQICVDAGGDFVTSLISAVNYLRNDITDWLLANFDVEVPRFHDCIPAWNVHAFSFIFSQKIEFTSRNVILFDVLLIFFVFFRLI
jgi:hypothetical protein